ncbi:autotransporter-associated beta strand repeat-containing protein, partial [Rhizobiaceae sp. 2RAB30]
GGLTIGGATFAASSATISQAISLSGAATFETDDELYLNGVISGAGSLTKTSSGDLYLGSVNSYSGTTTISAGRLIVGNGGNASLGSGAVINNSELVFALPTGNTTVAGAVSGSGSITKQGTGKVTFDGGYTLSGETEIEAGTVVIGGGTLGNGDFLNDGTLAFNRTDSVEYGGTVSG